MAVFLRRTGALRATPFLMAAILGGCNGTGMTQTVRSMQGGAPDPETPAFVVQSRAAAPSGYIPVGVTPPSRPTPVRSAGDVQKLEKELASQRDRTRAFANRPKPKSGYDGSIPRPAGAGNP
ncbi:MAG: hypothetical protein LCH39_00755 [Proteobacteria bacterium]|nr:hypothetical protein [Pseudomonadota bacterium]